jgi:hypothetical protein
MAVGPKASIAQAARSAAIVTRQEFHPMHTITVAKR